jgi:hypothetical protein
VIFGWASVAVGRSLPGAANKQQPEPLNREDESITESLAVANSLLLLFFSSFFQSICPRTP